MSPWAGRIPPSVHWTPFQNWNQHREPRVPETQVLRASYPAKDSRKNPTGQMEGSVFQQFEIRWRWHNSRKHQNQSVFTQTSVLVSLSHWLLFLFSSPFLINAICLFTIAACCGTCMATRVCLWRLTKDPHSTCLPSHDSDYTPPPHTHSLNPTFHPPTVTSYCSGYTWPHLHLTILAWIFQPSFNAEKS